MTIRELWNREFGNALEHFDYSGRLMKRCDIGSNTSYSPTIDHIRPLSKGGTNSEGNILICSKITNEEKGDSFPTWIANGKIFQAKKTPGKKGFYTIWGVDDGQ